MPAAGGPNSEHPERSMKNLTQGLNVQFACMASVHTEVELYSAYSHLNK